MRKVGTQTKFKKKKKGEFSPELLETKIGKYYLAKRAGKNKKEAQITAGFAVPTHSTALEASATYKTIESHFKEELLAEISVKEITHELADNIRQTSDKGAKNRAIEIAREIIEPKGELRDEPDKVLIVFR